MAKYLSNLTFLKVIFCHLIPPLKCHLSPPPSLQALTAACDVGCPQATSSSWSPQQRAAGHRGDRNHRSPRRRSLGKKSRPSLLSTPNAGKISKAPEASRKKARNEYTYGSSKDCLCSSRVKNRSAGSNLQITLYPIPLKAGALLHSHGSRFQFKVGVPSQVTWFLLPPLVPQGTRLGSR